MIIKDAREFFAMLEDGQFSSDFMDDFNATMQKCRDAAGGKGKAKGVLTLKIQIEVEGVSAKVDVDYTTKSPKVPRASTLFFATARGLSDSHPKQEKLPFRDVTQSRNAAAE